MNVTARTPLYQKIQQYIRELIESEGLKSGDRIPTEKELMERFDVSKITVVKALTGLANENIISRVPGKGSFVSEPEAAEEAEVPRPVFGRAPEEVKPRMGLIGLVMPSIYDYFAVRLIDGVRKGLSSKGYRTMILLSEGDLGHEKEAIKTLKQIGAEGILVFPVDEEHYNDEILNLKFSGYPFVLIDRFLPGVETNYIAADGRLGTRLAVEYLWELGHREIAICSDSPLQTVTVQERIEGYMDALKDKGALINPAHIITGFRIHASDEPEKHPLYRYIRSGLATAYITLNGKLGVQIQHMAKRNGLSIPGDLSIVSFDDPTSVVEDLSVFTHIKQFEYEMGLRAAETLVDIIAEGPDRSGGYTKTLLVPELVVGQTTGPVKPR